MKAQGFGGAGVLELIEDFDRGTYRAIYTVKYEGVVYVLHVFQKKATHGMKRPRAKLSWSGAATVSLHSTSRAC